MVDERGHLLKRLEQLERVSGVLQRDLDQLRADILRYEREAEPAAEPAVETTTPTRPTPPPTPETASGKAREQTVAAASTPAAKTSVMEEHSKKMADLEFWLGGRGLLLIGVAALVIAVGFIVREAIERGWIGPWVRVAMGGGIGVAAVVTGERIRAAGYRTYGLWLSAGGFSAIYVSIWAAVALYALVPDTVGFSMMVAVVLAAGALGLMWSSESFVGLAMLGGYLAPVLVPAETGSVLFSLGYLGLLSAAGLWFAYRANWYYLAAVSVLGGGLMPLLVPSGPHIHGVYLVVFAAFALLLARRREWREVSLLTVLLAWISYWVGSDGWGISGLAFASYAGALWLANLVASLGVRDWWPAELRARYASHDASEGRDASPGGEERVYELSGLAVTYLPPWVFFFAAMFGLEDSSFAEWQGEIGLALGVIIGTYYIAEAVLGRPGRGTADRTWRAALGFAFWVVAPAAQWAGIDLVRVWLIEGAALTLGGVFLRKFEARAAGLAAFVLATVACWSLLDARGAAEPAFVGPWALTQLGTALGLVFWPLALRRASDQRDWELSLQPILLGFAGLLFLVWGTQEIQRFWDLLGDGDRLNLARDLSISGFWMAYAVVLLASGFRLRRPPVRWAGLVMALIAAGKVFIYDLAHLAELYRIASFILLAIVLLALSFRYQKLRRGGDTDSG